MGCSPPGRGRGGDDSRQLHRQPGLSPGQGARERIWGWRRHPEGESRLPSCAGRPCRARPRGAALGGQRGATGAATTVNPLTASPRVRGSAGPCLGTVSPVVPRQGGWQPRGLPPPTRQPQHVRAAPPAPAAVFLPNYKVSCHAAPRRGRRPCGDGTSITPAQHQARSAFFQCLGLLEAPYTSPKATGKTSPLQKPTLAKLALPSAQSNLCTYVS